MAAKHQRCLREERELLEGWRDSGEGGERDGDKRLFFTDKLNLSHAKNIVFCLNDSSFFVFSRNWNENKADRLLVKELLSIS